MRIGLLELPAFKLVDQSGLNWTALRRREPLVSKQVLAPNLIAAGYDAEIINLKDGDSEFDHGHVSWLGTRLAKKTVGTHLNDVLASCAVDAWGITVNYLQERDIAKEIIRHLLDTGAPVVVGGSDAFSDPSGYLSAGAAAVVLDKSGGANADVLNVLLKRKPCTNVPGVQFANRAARVRRRPVLTPNQWPLPTVPIARQCLGTEYWEARLPANLLPVGSVFTDIGCDRSCDFCQTPQYKLGYSHMSAPVVRNWLYVQRDAGANSVILPSDQFLGRLLFKSGRADVLTVLQTARQLGLPVLWGNGLELGKLATHNDYLAQAESPIDHRLVQALFGWDGTVGCYHAYLPAERPLAGPRAYAKLLPFVAHADLVAAIVEAGVPDITYGVIIGLPTDSHDDLKRLEEAVHTLHRRLRAINPQLNFKVTPYAIRPLQGTPQGRELQEMGLIRYSDPAIVGGFWTSCVDTHFLSCEEVSAWQLRLAAIGDGYRAWQGVTGVFGITSPNKNSST